jgi:hypothetical protein
MQPYESLIQQLDRFIRKYYLSQLLKGTLLFTGALLSIYLLLSLGEFAFYFPSWMRWILITGFGITAMISLFFWVWKPLSGYLRLGNVIQYEQAAKIIGQHFSEVQDKLLNVLQLKSDQAAAGSPELIEASIQQKMQAISWVPFSNAIDLNENRKYLRYALPPIVLLMVVVLLAPNILTESNARLVQPARQFTKPAPFSFMVDEKTLQVVQFNDFELEVKVKGKSLPASMEWMSGIQPILMNKKDVNTFTYKVPNVQEDFAFRLRGSGYLSDEYRVKVLKKPIVSSMKISLNYPPHTGRKSESLQNTGDLAVPQGTTLTWELKVTNAEQMFVRFEEGALQEIPSTGNRKFGFQKRFLQDSKYKLYVSNRDLPLGDSVLFSITTIPDRHPSVTVEAIPDSADSKFIYFLGNASDDYGLSRLELHTRILNEKNQIKGTTKKALAIKKAPIIDFTHQLNVNDFELAPGDKLEYYFEIWDNDGVNGSKSARSAMFAYTRPTKDEYREMENTTNTAIKENLSSAGKEVKKLSKEIKQLRDKILTKKNLNWEDKKETEDLMKKHEELTKELEEIKKDFDESRKNQEEYKKVDEEILEKQELLSQMMDELLSQEMKDLMKELEDLLDKFMQNNAFERLDNMQMSNENLNKELDKMLELFKRMELEQKAGDVANQLEELAQKQEELENKTKSGETSPDKAAQQQEELNKEFDKIQDEMQNLEKLNQDQKTPLDLDQPKEMEQSIEKSMNDAQQQLQQNQPQKAGQQQKNAGDKMKEMAQNLKSQMSDMQMEQNAEDINTIRRILDNLLKLSKEQEEILQAVKKTQPEDPKYVKLIQQQYKLKEDAVLIEDSLTALGKRVFQLQTFISDELYKMKRELKKSITLLEARQRPQGAAAQQFVMTSANNLALMLSEAMDQMQQQMNSAGSGSCSKPGKGKPSMPSPGDLKKLQEQLGQDLQKMGQQMKQGQGGMMSKQLAEMAERQAAVREALRKMKDQMSQQQKKELGVDELIDKMDKNETDIVNRRITSETLKRQKEIETRMLELENAMREQGEDDKRQSKTADDLLRNPPARIEEYLKKRQSAQDIYRTVPPDLKPFYKNLVDKYFENNQER